MATIRTYSACVFRVVGYDDVYKHSFVNASLYSNLRLGNMCTEQQRQQKQQQPQQLRQQQHLSERVRLSAKVLASVFVCSIARTAF